MGKGQKSIGRYYKRVLSIEEVAQVEIDIFKGISEEEIRAKFQITIVLYKSIYQNLIFDSNNQSSVNLGHKHTAYYTEKELLKGIPTYTFKELSKHEKQFYLNYNLWKK
jgi:hypothetical protein